MAQFRTLRKGFTLGEILVSVAILAVLAAVVVPAVGTQITKGDMGRVEADLQNTRSAIEQFITDVRRYPRSISQLTNKPTVSLIPFNATVAYTANEVARWRGPYLSKDSLTAYQTGYGFSLGSSATSPVSNGIFGYVSSSTAAPVSTNGNAYLTIAIGGIDQATATAIDAAMDDGVVTTGALRWKAAADPSNTLSSGAKDSLILLAVPYQP